MKSAAPPITDRGALALTVMALLLAGASAARALSIPDALPLFLTALGLFLLIHRHVSRTGGAGRKLYARFALASLLLAVLWSLYLLNPSHRWEAGFGLSPQEHAAWLPATTMPDATRATGWVMFTGLAVAGCCMGLSHRLLRGLYLVIVVAGVAMAMWVLVDRVTPRPFPVFPVTGIFTSENHYAAFANLALPAALGLGWSVSRRARARGRVASAAPVFVMCALVMSASIVISGSRAGVAITALILTAFAWLLFRRSIWFSLLAERVKPRLVMIVLGLIALAGLGLAITYATRISGELSYRGIIMQDSLAIFTDRPWWGVGPGAFPHVMPYYQSEALGERVVLHAHNEPVQFIAEYGVLGVATLLAAFFVVMLPVFRRRAWTPEFSIAALALGGCSLHALVDFTFRHDVIALLAFAYAGVVAGQPLREAMAG